MTDSATKILTGALGTASARPSGARFYRCALQVNPFSYLQRHKSSAFPDEDSYNKALVTALKDHGVEVIAITDHYRVRTSASLAAAAGEAGITAFPGFEAVTKDGVHLLCLFDPDKDTGSVDRFIGDCGVHDDSEDSPVGKHDVRELLDACKDWGGVCVAAHVASDSGLLGALQGQSAVKAWQHPELLACSLPGPVSEAPQRYGPILQNKNPDYKRDRPIAVLNSQDLSDPAHVAKSGSSCWVKMSHLSVDGLRQAFLDPGSRIRLLSDPEPEEHTELVAMSWEGGFLDEVAIHFNENLNVLIGGRGVGKSTIIESVRYALNLNPLGPEATRLHKEFVKEVLKSGTRITLLIRSHHPTKRDYVVERTVPEGPVVRDTTGAVKQLSPRDVAQGAEVYGQHEISELTRSPDKLTLLLERFVRHDDELDKKKRALAKNLRDSRIETAKDRQDLDEIAEQLASLPALRETLKRFQEAGLEEKLSDRSDLVKEQAVLNVAEEKVDPFRPLLENLEAELPIDTSALAPEALKDLPAATTIGKTRTALHTLNTELRNVADRLKAVIARADKDIAAVHSEWDTRREKVEAAYQKILRKLQSEVDGEEFVEVKTKIEELRPLEGRKTELEEKLAELEGKRRVQLASWTDVHTDLFRELEKAAKRVNKQLTGRVKVAVSFGGNLTPLEDHLRQNIKGVRNQTFDSLRGQGSLDQRQLKLPPDDN